MVHDYIDDIHHLAGVLLIENTLLCQRHTPHATLVINDCNFIHPGKISGKSVLTQCRSSGSNVSAGMYMTSGRLIFFLTAEKLSTVDDRIFTSSIS
jgi:hypothetical protein